MKPGCTAKGASTVPTMHDALMTGREDLGGLSGSTTAKAWGCSIPQFHQGRIQSCVLTGRLSLIWAVGSSLLSISRSMREAILPPLCSCSSLFLNTSTKWFWLETALETALHTFIKAIHCFSFSSFSSTLYSVSSNFLLSLLFVGVA